MATVNGNNNSTTSAYSYLQFKNKIGGLVSGMDIDSIMEKLMKAQSAQMEKLQQQKQKYEWKRDAYREVNTKLNTFQQDLFDKYSLKSSWNTKTAAVSANNTAVNVQAGSNASGNLAISKVTTAKAAQSSFNSSKVTTEKITGSTALKDIKGLNLKTDELSDGNTLKIFNTEFDVSSEQKVSDIVNVLNSNGYTTSVANGQIKILETSDTATQFDSETQKSLEKLGFTFKQTTGQLKVMNTETVATKTTKLSDLGLTTGEVNFNDDESNKIDLSSFDAEATVDDLLTAINDKGYKATFSNGKISIDSGTNTLSKVTSTNINYNTGTVVNNTTSTSLVAKVAPENETVLQGTNTIQEVLGVDASSSGAFTLSVIQSDGKMKDTEISFKATDTISSLITKINGSGAGVTALFNNGQFSISSNSTGDNKDGSEIKLVTSLSDEKEQELLEADKDIDEWNEAHESGLALFSVLTGKDLSGAEGYVNEGTTETGATKYKDAFGFEYEFKTNENGYLINEDGLYVDEYNNILEEKDALLLTAVLDDLGVARGFDLASNGSNASMVVNGVKYEQSSNVFNIAGYDITAVADFNSSINQGEVETDLAYQERLNAAEKITIASSQDTTKAIDKVKEFVTMYNDLIAELNSKTTEKRNVDYAPLTDAQKAEMSESEITKWEEKAKAGLLKGDSTLNNVISKMRQTLFMYGTSTAATSEGTAVGIKGETLASIGIATSKTWSDNGKLEIDEDKLRAAIEKDPDIVARIFTGDGTKENPGVVSQIRSTAQAAVTTIEKTAGKSTSASETSYSIGKTINTLSTKIDDWKDRLKDIEERYWNQFSAMETAIQKANSQSSMFMQ